MSLAATIAKSLKQIETQLGSNVFTWDGNDYACAPSGTGEGGTVTNGGILGEADLTLVARLEVFPNGLYPQDGEKITYKGTEYRVDAVKTDSTGTFVRLTCEDPNRSE
jgi:hypothetical protein